ncbi:MULTISPECIES: prepilin peptidase [unclassified Clostridium]|uniref:prepilin peptidase n=1 Tax=unclassified Clostridium TaxID=2614128 RepID=UPI0011065941|nr:MULTISPECIES: prepilin peptidase [unclassified Clostridium]
MSCTLYGILAYCALMDVRHYRIPNRALAAAAAAGLAASAGAGIYGAGGTGLWAGDTGLWAGSTGLWTAAVMIAAFMVRTMLAAAAGFPFFLFRMVGAGDIKFMAVMAGCFGLERGFWSMAIGLCLGAILALGRMLRDGGICRRFLYLTAYIRRLIQSKEIEAYYCPERDGYQCVIPLGACFFAGMLITVLWKG